MGLRLWAWQLRMQGDQIGAWHLDHHLPCQQSKLQWTRHIELLESVHVHPYHTHRAESSAQMECLSVQAINRLAGWTQVAGVVSRGTVFVKHQRAWNNSVVYMEQ